MPTLEFYGAGGLEMTQQLAKALGRYAKYCCGLEGWKFKPTNLNQKDSREEEGDQIIFSIPVYFSDKGDSEEKIKSDETFYSFYKLIIGRNGIISDEFKNFCDIIKKKAENIRNLKKQYNNGDNIKLLNIQSGNENFWEKEISAIKDNTFYVFVWSKSPVDEENDKRNSNPEFLKKIKRQYEVKDKIWGYSKFMRDFLKIRNRCFEVELGEINNYSKDKIGKLIEYKTSKKEEQKINSQIDFLNNNLKSILSQYNLKKGDNSDLDFTDLAKLHLYNRNNHFETEYFDNNFNFVSEASGAAHGLLNAKDKLMFDPKKAKELGTLESKLFFYDLFKNVTDACISYSESDSDKAPDFIFLDDVNLSSLDKDKDRVYIDKYKRLHEWFSDSHFYYSTDRKFLDYLFNLDNINNLKKDTDYLKGFLFKDTELAFEDYNTTDKFKKIISDLNKKCNKPLFIGIDIDWNGEEVGLELLKQFRKNVHKMKRPCFIFVFSRYEYPSTIRKAIASGALFYVTKQNYMNLVHKVHLILRRLKEHPDEIIHPKYLNYENWHLLNKLEPAKVIELKTALIKGYKPNQVGKTVYENEHERRWIKKLPKADLHCHIGSCIGPDFLPVTALTVLSEMYPSDAFEKENEATTINQIKCIIDFVSLFVNGLELKGNNKVFLKQEKLKKTFGIKDVVAVCLFEWITIALDLEKKNVFPETALLDPNYKDMDLALFGTDPENEYLKLRQNLKRMNVSYDTIMLFFILMIFFKEKQIKNADDLKNNIQQILVDLFGCSDLHKTIDELLDQYLLDTIKDNSKSHIEKFINYLFKPEIINIETDKLESSLNYAKEKIEILKHLQTAKQGSSGSLFNYLRGCEYGGAPHLQTKTSIYLACYYIVHKYAIPDNIRYLTLRCAVDGYKKFGLFKSNEEAMEALLQGLAHAVKKANDNKYGKKIHVDVILTAKRHKSIEQFSQNVDVALKYRNGLLEEGQAKRFVKENLQEGFDNINSEWDLKKSINEKIDGYISTINDSNNHTTLSFFDTQPKVVSFDLAGLEKGNRAGKYYDQFLPLLKKCFPITIHAGEEDTYEGIWEAIYVVQSQRIGHALTLRNNKELLDIVKDRHIAIELCPLSNILTRDKSWEEAFPVNQRNDPEEYVKEECYPLRQYLMENIDVTINTDNPFISDTTLTDEFMVAAKMAGGLTKWEILRLIKNSFRSAALPKEQKKRLMDEIDDEIYSLLLDER